MWSAVMDDYELSELKAQSKKKRPAGMVWNILTILVLLVTVGIALAFLLIYINPNSTLNPFPPPTINPANFTATPSVTPRFTLVPSWTPTNIVNPPTETPVPNDPPVSTATLVEKPTTTPPATSAATTDYAFAVQQGSPAAIDANQFHPDVGCNWSGVAGQAGSLNGEAVRGLFVQLGGSLNGIDSVDDLTMTGLAPQYGQGGFEITLSDKLIASAGTLWIQLLDQQNLPLSDRVYFNTYDDCTKNLVIIYFEQVH
jgi:hypothetical protein